MSDRKYSFQTGKVASLTVVDYVLFALTLLISVAIGVVYAIKDRKKNDTKTFLLGGRSMGVVPVSMSLLASFMSALTLLGTPTEMYNYNTMFAWMTVAFIFSIAGAAHIFIPIFYNLGVTTAFEVRISLAGFFSKM